MPKKNLNSYKHKYYFLIVFFNLLITCHYQVRSKGVSTENQLKANTCKKNSQGNCTGNLFKINCLNFNEIVFDENNNFTKNSQITELFTLKCTNYQYFLFEYSALDKIDSQFFLGRELPEQIYKYTFDYVQFKYLNTGEIFTYPKYPEKEYAEQLTPSASPVEMIDIKKSRVIILFDRNNNSKEFRIQKNSEIDSIYILDSN
jgi:hypothetical protein